jgi:hypothetical protein
VLERVKKGEFLSVRSAAIEAGILKPNSPNDENDKQETQLA